MALFTRPYFVPTVADAVALLGEECDIPSVELTMAHAIVGERVVALMQEIQGSLEDMSYIENAVSTRLNEVVLAVKYFEEKAKIMQEVTMQSYGA